MESKTYKLLKKLGFNYSETQYGNISIIQVFKKVLITLRNSILLNWFMDSALLSPILPRFLRPRILKIIGCEIGKGVFIGANVTIDSGYADKIIMEENVHVAGHSIILCHQRNLKEYFRGGDYSKLAYNIEKVHLKRGCLIGTKSMIMPGVTVGEGAIVGAYSLVTKDIPEWTIATGRPAKVVKLIPKK
ncbi:acyltransferase [Tenacibaculum sp. FZY0031]|uniref:acyltransferase n=1 Tax=Tenacibaculum sp. FZY0031 TaxID=3116648 RepID=UPI002EA6DE92|nr:acyltransferase [Tenacibaculum sp. FZY0031]